jgi:transposase
MGKTFRAYDMNQQLLLPPDLRQWLRDDHLALYVSDVVEALDLSAFINSYEEGDLRGRPPYHPALMVKLLVYGYCTGRMSSRRLEQATYDDVAFRVLCCDQHPDHDSIAAFRKRHLVALGQLFVQVLQLCQRAGLVKLGHVAIDSTKIKANAAKSESLRYDSLEATAQALEAEVVRLLSAAQRIDEEEDSLYGVGRRADELPAELRRRETRLAKIRQLKVEMEREAQQAAIAEQQQKASGEPKNYRRRRWSKNEQGEVVPKDKTRRNLTDPESRLMMDLSTNSYQQAYNPQIAVDAQAQIIVGTHVTSAPNDQEQLIPTLLAVKKNLGQLPATVSADAGYFSSAVITAEVLRDIDLYVPPNEPEPSALPAAAGVRAQMWQKLMSAPGRELYKRRGTIVEPVFAYIKHVRRFRQFLLRGLAAVESEWRLICLTHNLLKLFRAVRPLPTT